MTDENENLRDVEQSGPIGILGLGIMGSAIARNLIRAGRTVVGYDPDEIRCEKGAADGVNVLANPSEVAGKCSIVLLSLPSSAALNNSVSAITEQADTHHAGRILVELSTLDLESKIRNRDRLAEVGVALLDSPISGTGAQALAGDISIYASGDRKAFERCVPIFNDFARRVHYLGEFGQGTRMKFVANLLVAIHNVATAEALVFGMRCGLDPDMLCEVIGTSAGNSKIFELRSPLMVNDAYDPPTMKLEVWQKDMELIAKFADEIGTPTPLFSATVPLYLTALKNGLGQQDTAAVFTVLRDMLPKKAALG